MRSVDGKTNDFIVNQMQGYNMTKALISQELNGIFNTETLRDMTHTMSCYSTYLKGAEFNAEGNGDYVPADWRCKEAKKLIDKEARFMFASSPDITIVSPDGEDNDDITDVQNFVDTVLDENHFYSKLVQAAKDCLIGKRIALVANFNASGISISFVPSLEFVYETDPSNVDKITKFIQFYYTVVNDVKDQQRVYKKKWELKDNGVYVSEGLYDGSANLVDELMPETKTELLEIPVRIIINDGLTGDPFGMSDIDSLDDSESWYSKLSSKDIDSIRKGTDQVVVAMDVNPKTTKNLSRTPGAFWDCSSDPISEGKTGTITTLDNSMAYSPALDVTLGRLKTNMHGQLDVPDTSNQALQGLITSGKTMRAIYWGLMVRCDEKMLVWIPAIRDIIRIVIEGSALYPESRAVYLDQALPEVEYKILIESNYPLMEDEEVEKATDMMEVSTKIRSRKSYMIKWFGYTPEKADTELDQIALETALLETENFGTGNTGGDDLE